MPRAPDLAGRALDGRYELQQLLGEGAFGRVYRGRDRRLGRQVAVKVIKPWWAEDSAWVERFQREARMLARVHDPGVVQIYDIGNAEEGPYYVAELVEGESLADRLQRGALPPEQARAIGHRLCLALASAHREGVVHCDVKPANVLLGTDGSVKVGDFGVARLADASSQLPSATIAGTPKYMSPEQARGLATSAASDVYSAGVVLYEMLDGRPPFEEGSPVDMGLRHLQDAPPPLPARVPASLAAVVERALEKDPSRRYADGSQMAAALERADAAGDGTEPVAPEAERNGAGGDGPRVPRRGPAPAHEGARPRRSPEPETSVTSVIAPATVDLAAATVRSAAPAPTAATRVAPGRAPKGSEDRTRALRRWRPPSIAWTGRRRRRAALPALLLLPIAGVIAGLLLTRGAATTTVPQLRGLPFGGVWARTERLHVHPVVSRHYSEAAPRGVAIAQDPAAGTRVAQGSSVHVVLSAGPPPVAVPGVIGSSTGAAASEIADAGLRYFTTAVAAPGKAPGVVVRQSPAASATVPRGSTIALSVAEAPRWRTLATFAGVDGGGSEPFHVLGTRWRVRYSMSFRGTCLLLLFCEGPSAQARSVSGGAGGAGLGSFELEEGEGHRTNSPAAQASTGCRSRAGATRRAGR